MFCSCGKSNTRKRVAGFIHDRQAVDPESVFSGIPGTPISALTVSEKSPGSGLQGTSEIQRVCSQEIQEEAQEVSDKVPFSGQSPVATEVEEDEVANKNYKRDLK